MAKPEDDEQLEAAIAALEAQRATLGDAVVEPALVALRAQRTQASRTTDERKLVTILFADIAGFTALSEKLDPEDVRRLINACFEQLVPIVQKYEGTIDKFIGDEIMALFGAPVAHEDDPERALRAALEMMDGIKALNSEHDLKLGMHIGINTGRVVAGSVGAKERRDYSVMGDAVNLAARLEDASEVGEIFVGPATYRATAALFDFETVPPLRLKGKEAPVEVHRLLGAKPERVRPRGIEGLRAPITGRDAELEEIRSALGSLASGHGSVVAIVGEAGLGKSRLIAETRALCPGKVRWIEGRALSYTSGRTFSLLREILISLLGVRPDAGPAKIADALEADLRRHFNTGWNEAYAFLGTVLEVSLPDELRQRVSFLSADALQGRILDTLREYVGRSATRHPLLMVWEDLHWCDPSSLRAFEEVAAIAADVPLLLVATTRAEDNPAAARLHELAKGHGKGWRLLELQPLNSSDSSALVESLLRIDNLTLELRQKILGRAEGNPFFIEELLRSLLDSGAIVLEDGATKLTGDVAAIGIPETLEEVLRARIDRLQPIEKMTLQQASVIGRIFDRTVLAQLHSGNGQREAKLDRALKELQQRQFIQSHEQQGSEAVSLQQNEFIFKHAITHDVTYESLLKAHRQELHAAAGSALERLFPDRVNDLSATLGFHFERGNVPNKAADYFERAGERAHASFAVAEAIEFYQFALTALDRLSAKSDGARLAGRIARLDEQLGDLLTLNGQPEQARDPFGRTLELLPHHDLIGRARIHRKIANTHSLQRRFAETEQSLGSADEILDRFARRKDESWWEEKVQVQLERMHLFYWQGMVPQMHELAGRYGSAIERNGTRTQQTKFLKSLSLAMCMESRFRPSAECVDLAYRAALASKDIPDLYERCYAHFTFGLIETFRGDVEEAVQALRIALELAERIGERVLQCRTLTYLALARRRQGDVTETLAAAERALTLAAKLAMVEYVAMAKANLAWVAMREDRDEDCNSLGQEALGLWHGMEDPYSMDWIALWPLIVLAIKKGDFTGAAKLMDGLVVENQHPLDEDVMSAIERARKVPTQKSLHEALVLARRRKYV